MDVRWLTFALFGLAPTTLAATAYADEPAAIGSAALSSEEDLAAARSACDASRLPGKPGGGLLKRYEVTFLASHTEFDPKTCKPHGAGSWEVKDQIPCDGRRAGCGEVSFGILSNRHLASGQCPTETYDFAAICYKWTLHANTALKDLVVATYHPPQISDVTEQFPIKVRPVFPDKEKVKFSNWSRDGYGVWGATISNKDEPKFDWTTGVVQEDDPGGGKPKDDSCWCSGSMYDAFYRITGGSWELEENGDWVGDNIGYGRTIIDYYRTKRRAPCGTSFPQQMQFQTPTDSGSTPWTNYGGVKKIGSFFNYKQLTSTRAGQSRTQDYNPKPTKSRRACSAIRFPDPAAYGKPGDRIVVDDPRPVAAAAAAIARVSGVAVTYEDSPVADRSRMTPMVTGAGADDALLRPKSATLEFALPAGRSPADAADAATKAAEAYAADGRGAARYAVLQDTMIHIVPREAADASGRLVAVTPALDSRITIKPGARSGFAMLQAICDAASLAFGRPIHVGTVHAPALGALKVAFGADNESARDVLTRLLGAAGGELSWRLLYDPGTQEYALNLAEAR
ncbi:hypothetical protein IHQ68_14235 [Chelatococcus sambhunathii]|uniref:Formylglycine-generating enzyme, required for sulfatase activity, contains SUMF1/FGE domain n=1 Tax=Chelatococcus sambhunathii TaxID=363953 RepID=A0ABU1DI61_9HYPH|nr:hypothetical protein [Chelatococcus sambhunathii]MDR4307779.1 hypothetical protein [Chelatococcus sambhunathii]